MADAVVIGAGPNGLVAANMLADRGWDVVVVEANAEPGGAVRSAELTVPGFCHDRFSSFFPLGAVSPPLNALGLENHGLRWRRAPLALGHIFDDGRCCALSMDVNETAAAVEAFGQGDGDAWKTMYDEFERLGPSVVRALLSPFPPVASGLGIVAKLKSPHALFDFVRFTLLPARRLADERFSGQGAAMLIAGNTLHTDLGPEMALGGFFGWLLAMLGQWVGFPVPEGGASALTDALVRRLEERGAKIMCGTTVSEVVVRGGRAVAVRAADSMEIDAPRAVLADVAAPKLYGGLVGERDLPPDLLRDLRRFHMDHGTVKVDWALRAPIPWTDAAARRCGTLHLGGDMNHLTQYSADLAMGYVPTRPFLLFGQMTLTDPTRSPPGTETAWAYTHVPTSTFTRTHTEAFVECIEREVEAHAPGFRDLIVGRHVVTPADLEDADANLVGGSVNGGTAQIHQQLVFRPTPGTFGPRTPVRGLYLASSSAHPGGGVHGACGANAALSALRADRGRRVLAVIGNPKPRVRA